MPSRGRSVSRYPGVQVTTIAESNESHHPIGAPRHARLVVRVGRSSRHGIVRAKGARPALGCIGARAILHIDRQPAEVEQVQDFLSVSAAQG